MRLRLLSVLLCCTLCFTLPAHADGDRILAKVISADTKQVLLDKGSSDGVSPGMLFDIYREAKVVFVPMTNEKVFVEEKAVAQIIVTSISAAASTGEIVKRYPDARISPGDTAVNVNPCLAPEVNAPPVVESMIPSRTQAYTGEEITINCEISDVNDTFHIFEWACDAGQLSAKETVVGEVRWLSPPERTTTNITVLVRDPHGAQVEYSTQVESLGPGPRGKTFMPVASFGEITPRFLKISFAAFDSENHLLLLDQLEKRLITLSQDYNILRVSALYGEEFSFSLVKVQGENLYAVDSKSGSLNRYRYEGDIFRRKPDVVYGARGSGNGYFGKIADVAVSPDGSVYILDSSACAVHVFSPDGKFVCSLGKRGDQPGDMRLPTALAMDLQGNFYVSDYTRRKIIKFARSREFVAEFDVNGQLGTPVGVRYIRRSNALAVLERQPHKVRIISTTGKLIREFAKPENELGVIADPEQIAVSHTGEIFLVCENGEVIRRYSERGEFLGKMGGEKLANVSSFSVTPEGGLYLLDSAAGHVWFVDRDGWVKSRFGGIGSNAGQFQSASAVCSDVEGNAYVLDETARRILKFTPDGGFVKFIGEPGTGKNQIERPIDLCSTGDRIYLLQYRNRWCIHVYSPDGRLLQLFPDKESETSRPSQIAVDTAGNSFIFTGRYTVEFYDREGAKQSGVRKAGLWLTDIAVDARGDIVGTSPVSGEILRMDPKRPGAEWMLDSTAAAPNCQGISFDRYGRMYLFDKNSKAIVRLSEVVR